jgi:hypothetical protein
MQASDEHSKLLRIFSKLPADIVLQAARAGDQRTAVELLMAVSRLDTDGQVPSPRSLHPIYTAPLQSCCIFSSSISCAKFKLADCGPSARIDGSKCVRVAANPCGLGPIAAFASHRTPARRCQHCPALQRETCSLFVRILPLKNAR